MSGLLNIVSVKPVSTALKLWEQFVPVNSPVLFNMCLDEFTRIWLKEPEASKYSNELIFNK